MGEKIENDQFQNNTIPNLYWKDITSIILNGVCLIKCYNLNYKTFHATI